MGQKVNPHGLRIGIIPNMPGKWQKLIELSQKLILSNQCP
jgi:hypothetical protein